MSGETPSATQRPPSGRRLQVDILSALVALLVLTVGVIAWNNHRASAEALKGLADSLMDRVSDAVIVKTKDYLSPAGKMAAVTSAMLEGSELGLPLNARLEQHARAVVSEYHQLAMFSIGDEGGNFLLARRMKDGSIATKRIDRRAGGEPQVQWVYHDVQGRLLREEAVKDDYDPRARPWYVGARDSNETFWSDLYIFHSDHTPGITASKRVLSGGKPVGVVGVDIELGALSAYLATLTVGETGRALIVNERGDVVAYPGEMMPGADGDSLKPRKLGEFGHRWLADSYEAFQKAGPGKFNYKSGERTYLAAYTPFPADFGKPWMMAVVVPESEMLGSLERAHKTTFTISIVVLLVAIMAAIYLSRTISRPILQLTEETRRITNFEFDSPTTVRSGIREIQEMTRAVQAMKTALGAFRRYVPANLVRQLIQTGDEARLGGSRRELTVFFSDIAGFTTLSEKIPPEELMLHVSEYLDELTRIVMDHHGTVDKYIGDAIMAFWNAPLPVEEHAVMACRTALRCQQRLNELNARWTKEGKEALPTRIGIGTGEVVVGNLGSKERMNYTAVGDTVNLAARLEGANKVYGTSIILAEATALKVASKFWLRPIDMVAVKGKNRAIRVFELLAERGTDDGKYASLVAQTEVAFAHYLAQRWPEAKAEWKTLATTRPDDAVAKLYLGRLERLASKPHDPAWDGILRLEEK